MIFFDIHTHKDPDRIWPGAIVNLSSRFDRLPPGSYYSAGLHPWFIESETVQIEWESLKSLCKNENILAIGECGLDKVCKTDWALQKHWFKKQVDLANSLSKPLIIHCVRAFEEVLMILKESGVQVPVIFHGFNKSLTLAQKILHEDFYLSFGKHLVLNEQVQDVFRQTPLDRLFLETDAAEVSIEDIYRRAAFIKGLELDELSKIIAENIAKVFGAKFRINNE